MIERQEYLDGLVKARGYVLDYQGVSAGKDPDALRAIHGLIEALYPQERPPDRKTKELLFVPSLTVMRSEKGHIESDIQAVPDAGASEEVLEAIEISLPKAGVVAFQPGFDAWQEATGAVGLESTVEAYEAGGEA